MCSQGAPAPSNRWRGGPAGLDILPTNMPSIQHLKSKAKAKILVADGEAVFRLGLKKLFSVEDDLRVVAQAEDCWQLTAMAKSFKPNLAIVQQEIALDGCYEVFPQIFRASPECKVIVTGSKLTKDETERLFQDGASGVILRSERPEAFVQKVRSVINGQTIQNPGHAHTEKVQIASQDKPDLRPVDTLTRREKTIISCLTQGWRNKDVARHLTISEQTVKNHLRSIYDKVGVSDRLELVLYAIHQQIALPPVDSHN